jgi:hypothetical protein
MMVMAIHRATDDHRAAHHDRLLMVHVMDLLLLWLHHHRLLGLHHRLLLPLLLLLLLYDRRLWDGLWHCLWHGLRRGRNWDLDGEHLPRLNSWRDGHLVAGARDLDLDRLPGGDTGWGGDLHQLHTGRRLGLLLGRRGSSSSRSSSRRSSRRRVLRRRRCPVRRVRVVVRVVGPAIRRPIRLPAGW